MHGISSTCPLHHVICCLHSKSARRKKREEAQKLPQVSPEIFYQVSSDLKGVFGQTKEDLSNPEKTNWDQVKEEEDRGKAEELQSSLLSEDPTTTKEGSSGFKFSFFGVDAEASGRETSKTTGLLVRSSFHFKPLTFISFNSWIQSGEHPGSKGVMAAKPMCPWQQLWWGAGEAKHCIHWNRVKNYNSDKRHFILILFCYIVFESSK